MRRALASMVAGWVALFIGACGGSAFTSGNDASGGAPATSQDGSVDGAGSSPEGGGVGDAADGARETMAEATADVTPDAISDAIPDAIPDATADAPGPVDALADVVEEPPAHCGGSFACAPSVPDGWSGPLELYTGSTPAPACGNGFAGGIVDAMNALSSQPATCSCACGSAQGVVCSTPSIDFFPTTAASCGGLTPCATEDLTEGACTNINETSACNVGAIVMSAPASTASGGTCAPQLTKSVPSTSWGRFARACSSALGTSHSDCGGGTICAPRPASPYDQTLCISQAGDVPCPTMGYTSKQTFYGGVDDSRDCSACTCVGVTGATCSGTISVFPSTGGACGGGAIQYDLPAKCAAVQQPADFRLIATSSGGSCAASQVSPIGMALPIKAITYCCM